MPWSNLAKRMGSRALADSVVKKSQTWASLMVPSLAVLIGFFKDNLLSIATLIVPFAVSWIILIIAMEFADFSEVKWQILLAEGMYYGAVIILFIGIFSYTLPLLGYVAWLFAIPMIFYALMVVYATIMNTITIYRGPLG